MNNQDRLIIEKEQLNNLVNSCQEEIRRLKDKFKIQKQKIDAIKFYIEQSDIKDMLWGKEILKIIGENDE